MVKPIRWSDHAKTQLTDILYYYHYKANHKFAQKLLDDILHATSLLQTNPLLGFIEPQLKEYGEKYRSLIEGYYKIIYTVDPLQIRIMAIFDCRQSPDKLNKLFNA